MLAGLILSTALWAVPFYMWKRDSERVSDMAKATQLRGTELGLRFWCLGTEFRAHPTMPLPASQAVICFWPSCDLQPHHCPLAQAGQGLLTQQWPFFCRATLENPRTWNTVVQSAAVPACPVRWDFISASGFLQNTQLPVGPSVLQREARSLLLRPRPDFPPQVPSRPKCNQASYRYGLEWIWQFWPQGLAGLPCFCQGGYKYSAVYCIDGYMLVLPKRL